MGESSDPRYDFIQVIIEVSMNVMAGLCPRGVNWVNSQFSFLGLHPEVLEVEAGQVGPHDGLRRAEELHHKLCRARKAAGRQNSSKFYL